MPAESAPVESANLIARLSGVLFELARNAVASDVSDDAVVHERRRAALEERLIDMMVSPRKPMLLYSVLGPTTGRRRMARILDRPTKKWKRFAKSPWYSGHRPGDCVANNKQNAGATDGLAILIAYGDRGRAALASIALHAALVLALVGLRFAGEPGLASTTEIVRVALVSVLPDAAPQSEAPAPASDAPSPEPAVAVVETDVRPEPQPPEPAPAAPEPVPTTPEPVPEVAPEVAVVLPTPTVPKTEVAAPKEPSPPKPQTVSIDAAEFEMLDRRITELAARFDVVTERQDVVWRHRGQTYNATLERVPAADSMSMDELKVTVSTEQDGRRLSTQLGMRRLAFSSFAQFVDRWDPQVRIHDDEFDGRFHSNSTVYVERSGGVQPAFHGEVTIAQNIDTSYSEHFIRRDEVFLGGLETRVPKIFLPRRVSPLSDEREAAQVHELSADARITFYADGSYSWRYVEASAIAERATLGDEPHYLVAAEDATLYLRGIVNGKVLVYSPRRIVIENDVTYAAHPAFVPDSDDFLGLVSDGNVEIAEPEATGPGDITVHAAIFAKRSFTVRSYGARGLATLNVYGSVAAGSVSATEPRFRTKVQFDDRLANLRPPSFPLTDRYELGAWDGLWIMDE